jgi:hypothetical protein
MSDFKFRKKEKEASENISNIFLYKPKAKKIQKEISDYLAKRK